MIGKSRKNEGFALVAGLLMVALVVAASVALINVVSADVGRSLDEADGAQMRQLLLAGGMFARDHAEASVTSVRVALPPSLEDHASVDVTLEGDEVSRTAHVRAAYLGKRVEQAFRFRNVDNKWIAIDVRRD